MENQNSYCDVAIIGCGITGLCAAYRLRELLPNHKIKIFERNRSIGGRLLSVPLSMESGFVDLGAGRYNSARHIRLHNLIQELGIQTTPFSYELAPLQNALFDHTREKFRAICNDLRAFFDSCSPRKLERWSFWDATKQCLGETKCNFIVESSGYDSLRNPKLPLKYGLDILFKHPETEFLSGNVSGEWATPIEGFQSLSKTLANSLSLTCDICLDHDLKYIKPQSSEHDFSLSLNFSTDNGSKTIQTKHVVCATTIQDFLNVDGCNVSELISNNIVAVPLTKGYIEYKFPWWQSMEIAGQCFTNSSPFRKIYFPMHHPYLLVYADGESAINLKNISEDINNVLQYFEAVVKQAVPFDIFDKKMPIPIKQEWKFWDKGISFWDSDFNIMSSDFWSYASNIYFCSDLCTKHIGWVEGGIVSAESAAKRISKMIMQDDRRLQHYSSCNETKDLQQNAISL